MNYMLSIFPIKVRNVPEKYYVFYCYLDFKRYSRSYNEDSFHTIIDYHTVGYTKEEMEE